LDESEPRDIGLDVAPGGPGDDEEDDEPPIREPTTTIPMTTRTMARSRCGLAVSGAIVVLRCSTLTEFLV